MLVDEPLQSGKETTRACIRGMWTTTSRCQNNLEHNQKMNRSRPIVLVGVSAYLLPKQMWPMTEQKPRYTEVNLTSWLSNACHNRWRRRLNGLLQQWLSWFLSRRRACTEFFGVHALLRTQPIKSHWKRPTIRVIQHQPRPSSDHTELDKLD